MKSHSNTPVSNVLAWSCHRFNPVRSEYLVLEKCAGQQLTEVWEKISESDRVKLIRSFAKLESELAQIQYPGYGALYLRHELPAALVGKPSRLIDVDETYCLGPMYHGAWPGGFAANPEQYSVHAGPCKHCQNMSSASAYLILLPQQGKPSPNWLGRSRNRASGKSEITKPRSEAVVRTMEPPRNTSPCSNERWT